MALFIAEVFSSWTSHSPPCSFVRASLAPSSQPVEYYLKHTINEKLIKGLVDNNRFNDSLSGVRLGKVKEKTYNLSPRRHVYEAILKEKITKKEDIGGNFEIPYNIRGLKDFEILDIKENKKRPFILGTPFLTTANAMIKFDKGTITLRSRKSKISFHRIPESLCKDEKWIKNDIEHIAPTVTVNKLVLEWEEKIKLHQEKEMEFDQWRSKNFKNEHPALVKIKDGMDDEGEVTESNTSSDHNLFYVTSDESSDDNPFQFSIDESSDHNIFQITSNESTDDNPFQVSTDNTLKSSSEDTCSSDATWEQKKLLKVNQGLALQKLKKAVRGVQGPSSAK
ncbi:hypothetical protein Tco_1492131 [Tanacetum coccineum]